MTQKAKLKQENERLRKEYRKLLLLPPTSSKSYSNLKYSKSTNSLKSGPTTKNKIKNKQKKDQSTTREFIYNQDLNDEIEQ